MYARAATGIVVVVGLASCVCSTASSCCVVRARQHFSWPSSSLSSLWATSKVVAPFSHMHIDARTHIRRLTCAYEAAVSFRTRTSRDGCGVNGNRAKYSSDTYKRKRHKSHARSSYLLLVANPTRARFCLPAVLKLEQQVCMGARKCMCL